MHCTTTMAADNHTTCRKHQHQPNTQRPRWGPDLPHAHFTHAQPPPPANKARTSLKGKPRGLGLGPANGWAALSKRFGGYPNSAPTGGAALPG